MRQAGTHATAASTALGAPPRRGRRLVALAVLLGSAAAVPAAADPGADGPSRCDAHRSYRRTQTVLVFRTGPADHRTYSACARPAGRPVSLASTTSADRLASLTIAGHYVAVVDRRRTVVATAPPCDKNSIGQPCCDPSPQQSCREVRVEDVVGIADTRRRTRLDSAGQGPPVRSLALSPAGAAAWLVPAPGAAPSDSVLIAVAVDPRARPGLTGCPYEDPRELDRGAITAVGVSRHRVRWSSAGRSRSRVVRPRGRDVEAVC